MFLRRAVLLVLVLVVNVGWSLGAVSRVRRQQDGQPWWKQQDSPASNIDKETIEAIFGVPNSATSTTTTTTTTTTATTTTQKLGSDGRYGGSSSPEEKSCAYECVPYYLCRNGEIVTDGTGIIDVRTGPGSSDAHNRTLVGGNCPGYIEVCCRDPNAPLPTTPPYTAPYTAKCGQRNPDGVFARITGFTEGEAQFGEFPWMAAILKVEKLQEEHEVNLYQCGGSLIWPNVVLTAAHCVAGKNQEDLKVRLGEWNTQSKDEILPYQDVYVKRIKIHQDYYGGALINDVALLFLESPAELAPNVDTVCLPPYNFNFTGATCWATGWGKDEFGQSGSYQNILKSIDLPVVSKYSCEESLRRTRLGKWFRLHPSFVCAGGKEGKDTCKGDGGGPLVCQDPNDRSSYVQVGIVAWGIGCGEDGTPGVYADVTQFVSWIKNEIDTYNS